MFLRRFPLKSNLLSCRFLLPRQRWPISPFQYEPMLLLNLLLAGSLAISRHNNCRVHLKDKVIECTIAKYVLMLQLWILDSSPVRIKWIVFYLFLFVSIGISFRLAGQFCSLISFCILLQLQETQKKTKFVSFIFKWNPLNSVKN